MDDTKALLREYAQTRSETAFRALVTAHAPVIYGTALRKLGGDRAAAQDVTQEVFTLLARKAGKLESVVIGGWLYRQTCRRAANHIRSESRRRSREKAAGQAFAISPASQPAIPPLLVEALDDALLTLSARDRDALVLRFFEAKGFRLLGDELGLSEEAARKRVNRALDRLGAHLKRKGLAVGSASLASAMQSFAAAPVPATVISQVCNHAWLAGTGHGQTSIITLFKPALAGITLTSIAAGSTLALRAPVDAGRTLHASREPQSSQNQRPPIPVRELPAVATLEQILAEIRRIKSGPGNVLTTLRLRVALAKIRIDQIPEFVTLADQRLNPAERGDLYQPLLELWWNQEPNAAMTFILVEHIDARIMQPGSTYLIGEYFRRWAERDHHASLAWLLRHWDHEILLTNHSGGAFRNFLSMWVTGKAFSQGDVRGVFAAASKLPTPADQAGSLMALVGMAPMHSMWTYSDAHQDLWLEFHRGLEVFPDDHWRQQLVRNFWRNLGESQPEKVHRIQSFMNPADPFEIALGLLAVKRLSGAPVKKLSGGLDYPETPVTYRARREMAAWEAGLARDLSREQIHREIGGVLVEVLTAREFFEWLELNPDGPGLDGLLSIKAAEKAVGPGYDPGEEMEALEWAARINDPDLRRSVSRGAFRRLLARFPAEAKNFLNTGLPHDDLKNDFLSVLNEAP